MHTAMERSQQQHLMGCSDVAHGLVAVSVAARPRRLKACSPELSACTSMTPGMGVAGSLLLASSSGADTAATNAAQLEPARDAADDVDGAPAAINIRA